MTSFVHDQYIMFIPFVLIGCAWAAILSMPFTFVTNALEGYGHMGAYLGYLMEPSVYHKLLLLLWVELYLQPVGSNQSDMMIVAGGALVAGALSVSNY